MNHLLYNLAVSAVYPAGCIFGKSAGSAAFERNCIAYDVRQKIVPFYFENNGGIAGRNGHQIQIQKIGTPQTGADIVIHGDPHIAGGVHERFPRVIDDGLWLQSLA